jgi:hypothetical protein
MHVGQTQSGSRHYESYDKQPSSHHSLPFLSLTNPEDRLGGTPGGQDWWNWLWFSSSLSGDGTDDQRTVALVGLKERQSFPATQVIY